MINLITEHIHVWSAARTPGKNGGRGRGKGSNGQSPHGIKKLRELILELAVRGKLVPQDPKDEPAGELLKKISKEKARLTKEGKIKKQNPFPEIREEEKPFDLPRGWEWERLGEIGETNIGLTYSPTDVSDFGIPVLRSNNIQNGKLDLSDLKRIKRKLKESVFVQNGDLLICARNGSRALVGKAALIINLTEKMAFGAFMAIFRSHFNQYLLRFINSPLFRRTIDDVNTMTINQITQNNLKTTIFPLPPLAEQHRIVAKVDELMALCDKLEWEQTGSDEAHETLVETLLATLSTADHKEFIKAWERIASHFDALFTTEESIDKLKQTILQLAVMGKLVPQDPRDEPASELLKKIAKEKARLIKEGKIKKQKPLPEIREEEKPFELPKGWDWVSLSYLGVFSGGKTPSKAKNIYWNGDIPWVTPKDMKVPQILDTEDHVTVQAIDDGLALYEPEALFFVVRSGILRRTFPVAIAKVPCSVNQDLKVLSLFFKELNPYIYLMMRGFEQYILKNLTKIGMTVESVMFEEFANHYFMLPPLPEQHRIVSKVDELMALCDSLKARLKEAQATQVQLADAIVEQAVV